MAADMPGYIRLTMETRRRTREFRRELSPRAYRAVMTAAVVIVALSVAGLMLGLVLLGDLIAGAV